MTREELYKLTDILNSEVLGNFMHGGEADELIAMFEEAVEHSNILYQPISDDFEKAAKEYVTKEGYLAGLHYNSMVQSFKAGAKWQKEKNKQWLADNHKHIFNNGFEEGFEVGRDDMEEQLKKDAIYGEWFQCRIILPSEYYADDIKKVKLIIVKED